ncbi:hypothetical protein [Mesorhizobium opportunistum]|uniref:Uncharacterized protein n=1 Tax=Mesorhizobium opportunistum (strain LMG 24607 / HAMBI 3007 / WSM2075) TaxID=536019 RepID=F7XZV2_MESOW|nr:hypothetical protein [Mesorhizobium opportunistum]AEH88166.1 conserved hypothetical protein [Mesorhizobium opportunistum WSM2075]
MSTTIVFGPMACGKTRNAEALRRHFGCDRVVDEWDGRKRLPENSLALTIDEAHAPGARTVSFADAMKMAGGA